MGMPMTTDDFTVQILDMKKTLYHVACGILRSEADREDAVQEYERRACTPIGKLIAARELPVLRLAKELLELKVEN